MPIPQTLVVAVSQAALERRRRQLLAAHQGCLLGFKFQTLRGLALELVQEQIGLLRLADAGAADKLLRAALAGVVGDAVSVWLTDGAVRQVGEAIAKMKLRGRSVGQFPAAAELSANASIVTGAWRRYQDLLDGRLDEADAVKAAIELIRNGTRSLSLRADTVELVGYESGGEGVLEPWERELFLALQERGGAKIVEDQPLPAVDAVFGVMAGTSSEKPPQPTAITFQRAPSPEVERRVLARTLRRALAEKSITPENILILHPGDRECIRNLVRVLDEYELPHDGALALSMADTPLAEFVLKFAGLSAARFTWQDWLWLGSSPFVTRQGKGLNSGTGLGKLARLLATYKLRAGALTDWRAALPNLRTRLEADRKQLEDRLDKDDTVAEQLERVNDSIQRVDEIKTGFDEMLAQVESSLLSLENRTPAQWAAALGASLAGLGMAAKINSTAATTERLADERAAWGALHGALRELQATAEQLSCDRQEFLARLRSELGRRTSSDQRRYHACISLRTPDRLERGGWMQVYVIGCNAGALPAQAREGGILTDADHQRFGLPTSQEQNVCAAAQFHRALTLNQATLLISHTALGSDGKPCLPSPFLQRLDDALARWDDGKRSSVFYNGAPAKAGTGEESVAPWCPTLKPQELLPARETVALPEEVAVADRLNNAPSPVGTGLFFVDDNGAAAYWDERNWAANAPTPQTVFGEFAPDEWPKHVLRPSALDYYAQCPYKYFAQQLLKLEALAELDLAPDAMTMGTAMHEILEKGVGDWLKAGKIFTAKDDAEYDAKVKELGELIDTLAKAQFMQLAAHSVMSFPPDLVERLGRRWATTLKATLTPSLVQEPASQSDWQKKETEKRPKKALSADAERLLNEMECAYFNNDPFTQPDEWPPGTKSFLGELWKLVEKRQQYLKTFFTPAALEWSFASVKAPLAVDLNGVIAHLAGTIDRVDVHRQDGEPVRVRLLDYKTSKPNNMSTAKDLKDGKALQLAAYAVAFDALRVQGKLPSSIPAAAILQQLTLFTVRTGKENTAAMDHLVSHCQKLIGNAAKAIHEGKLAPVPRKGCLLGGGHGFCDFADLCRARHIPQNWLRNGYEETKPADATVPTPTGGQQP